MLELEVIVVVIGLRSEADLLDDDLDALSLLFLLLLLELEDELLIVDDATYWRIDIGRDLHEVKLLVVSDTESLLYRIYSLLYIVPDEAHFLSANSLVDAVLELLFVVYCHSVCVDCMLSEGVVLLSLCLPGVELAVYFLGNLLGKGSDFY